MSYKLPINFDIPVILSPGEILSVNNTTNYSTSGILDLHIQTIIKQSSSVIKFNKGIQTENLFEFGKSK